MIATDKTILHLKPGEDYVFLLDGLELTTTKEQLKRITNDWNDGASLEDIAESERRNSLEILIALIHQASKGHKLRPFSRRIK